MNYIDPSLSFADLKYTSICNGKMISGTFENVKYFGR